MSTNFISMPSNQFKLSDGSRIAKSGKLYVGKANTDPTVTSNQILVTGFKSDGSSVAISQPITLNSLGFPQDEDGNIISLSVDVHYSIAIFDAYGKLQLSYDAVEIQKVPSIDKLRLTPGLYSGQSIQVVSYHDGYTSGGGSFTYDPSLASVDNAVTVFKGWVRDTQTELSTWDAGLIPDDLTDASPSLQRLFDASKDGAILYIDGRHCITRPHTLRGKVNLKIIPRNGGFLDGVTLRTQFDFNLVDGWGYYAPTAGATQGYPGGIISALDCDNLQIGPGLKIRGPKKRFDKTAVDVTLRREYGDSAVQLRNCPNAKINGNDFLHFWAWGIYSSAGGHNSEANENMVGDCAVQSGIAIWNGCNYCQANNNTIPDARLYGLEIEILGSVKTVYGGTLGAKANGNKITGAKWGVAVVGGIIDAEVTKSTLSNCFYGISAVKNKDLSQNISIVHNTVSSSLVHVHISGSQNVNVGHNDLIATVKPDYAVLNQYSVIIGLETNKTQFRIFFSGNSRLTETVQIRGQVYTVTNRTVVDDPTFQYGESKYVVVTVERVLATDVEVGDTLLQSTAFADTTAHATSLIYTEDDAFVKAVTFGKNNLIGGFKVYERFETVFSDQETIAISSFGHSLIKTANNTQSSPFRLVRNSAWANAIELRGTDHSEGLGFYLPVKSGGTKNIKPYREITFSKTLSIAAGAVFPIEYFYDNTDRVIIGIDVTLINAKTNSAVQLKADGQTIYTNIFPISTTIVPVATFRDKTMTLGLAGNANSGTGRHAIQLFTADNSAVCDGYVITIYLL